MAASYSDPKLSVVTPEDIEKAYWQYAEASGAYAAELAAYYVKYQVYLAALGALFGDAPVAPVIPTVPNAYSGVEPPADALVFKTLLDGTAMNAVRASGSLIVALNGGWGAPTAYTYD